MTPIILPSEAAFDELRADGFDVVDPIASRRARRAFAEASSVLARACAVRVCGMTSRAAQRNDIREVHWFTGDRLTPWWRRLSSFEAAAECMMWAHWLAHAMGEVRVAPDGTAHPIPLAEIDPDRWPPPPPRPFLAPTWPDIGLRARRRTRARRS